MEADNKEEVVNFYKAVLCLKTQEECEAFFADILSPKELVSIPQRLEVARLLSEGRPFLEITEKTGASTATIGRVSHCVKGEAGGYRLVLGRMK